jgi:hypothetical protein
MENLIIKNLLEQIEKLTEENKKLIKENKLLKNNVIFNDDKNNSDSDKNNSDQDVSENNIIKKTTSNACSKAKKDSPIELYIKEEYQDSKNIADFEILLKTKITEKDTFNCIYKSNDEIILDILTREISNKEDRPFHAIKYNKKTFYYLVKINEDWFKTEFYEFNKTIKRLLNIISHTMAKIFYNIKKTNIYKDGGSGVHRYKNWEFDNDVLMGNLMSEINYESITNSISKVLEITL